MYAEFNTEITVKGTPNELAAVAEVLWESRNLQAGITLRKINTNGEKHDLFWFRKRAFCQLSP